MTAVSLSEVSPTRPPGDPPEVAEREIMRGGIAMSASLHVAVLVLIILGLPSLFHRPPPQETPIAVQLVTVAPDTRATQPNPFRPKPEAKPEPPVAAPAPKPEPKPEPPPPAVEPPSVSSPPPVPAPPEPVKNEVKTPPPLPPPPKPKPEQQQAAQPPRPEKRADPAAFDKLMKNLEEKKPRDPAAFDNLLKNLTQQQTAQSDEPPQVRPRVVASAPPSSQPKAPLGSQLTVSEQDALIEQVRQQLTPCWNIPAGARDARDLVVEIKASVGRDGTVRQATIVDQGRMSDPLYRAAAESARRTFFNPSCTPLKLPPDKYEDWKDLTVAFNPKDIL